MRDGKLLIELHAIVKGRVQGVGFRANVKQLADVLKLTGFVRNLVNGDVEICAQGERAQLEGFLSQLQQKFPPEFIESIDSDFHNVVQIHSDFRIVR